MANDVDRRAYPAVAQQPNYPALETAILASWAEAQTFAKSINQRAGAAEYVFNDGPPFANGLPHYGHLLTGFVKDALPRYKTMRGFRVERRFGWDCHGLPAETEAEKELGVSGRGPITAYGIDRFNDYCRSAVLRYVGEWEHYVTRQARWVDFVDDYKTMDLSYMESVIWAFKALHERGLIYEAYRVLPYCWECETPLSVSETRLDDAYRERVDPAVTVAFRLAAVGGDRPAAGALDALVWTTTPWTLPSNLALAVGAELRYVVVEHDGRRLLIGKDRLPAYAAVLGDPAIVDEISGAELVTRSYTPLFPYFADEPGAFVVLAAPWVSTDEGTGIVHLAPGFGEDDQRVCEEHGIAVVCPVDERGCFDERVPDLAGKQVFAANGAVINALAEKGALVSREDYAHSYPHCWRTDTPLIYRAASSFFVNVTALKDDLLSANNDIAWYPAHVRDGAFGKWLAGARDWSITRNRFWGTPIPVWKSDDPAFPRIDVYGSLDELAADFGVRPTDLHRPAIDELTRPNPDDPSGAATMRRVSDVLDCWFESGAMPFAQLHYPFEGNDAIDAHVPADFITEYIGQTRAWFYYQHVLAVALFGRPAFTHCIAHGVVLGDDGRKLSKRLRNFPDPEEFFESAGSDTMRWYLMSSPVLRGHDVAIEEHAMREPIRQVLNPLWNTWYFLSLYGGTDNTTGRMRVDQTSVLDRYILAKTAALSDEVTAAFERYDLAGACNTITRYLDALTNWYVRRSRDRFWRSYGGDARQDAEKSDAYDTLHTVLAVTCRISAPLLPLLTEEIYRGLTSEESVHLTDWPAAGLLPADDELVESMDLVRAVCSAAHSIRKAEGLRARLPLRTIVVAGPAAPRLAPYRELIADELNVKEVLLQDSYAELAAPQLQVVPAALGPRLGAKTQDVIVAVRAGSWVEKDGVVSAGGIALEDGEYLLALRARDDRRARVLSEEHVVVMLDTEVSADLAAEGSARDVVRFVQQDRKALGLHVADRIDLVLGTGSTLATALSPYVKEIAEQTLSKNVTFVGLNDEAVSSAIRHELADDQPVAVSVQRAP